MNAGDSRPGDLSINRGSELASGAKVAAARAPKGKSSGAGAKPELPVCGQVGCGSLPACPCEARAGVCVGPRLGCPFGGEAIAGPATALRLPRSGSRRAVALVYLLAISPQEL